MVGKPSYSDSRQMQTNSHENKDFTVVTKDFPKLGRYSQWTAWGLLQPKSHHEWEWRQNLQFQKLHWVSGLTQCLKLVWTQNWELIVWDRASDEKQRTKGERGGEGRHTQT